MKIFYDENICVRCLACVSESEFGGVICERKKIHFDETKPEDWENIAAICPVGAVELGTRNKEQGTSFNSSLLTDKREVF